MASLWSWGIRANFRSVQLFLWVQLPLNIALPWQAVYSAKNTSVMYTLLFGWIVWSQFCLKLPLGDCVPWCYAQLVIFFKTVVAVYQQSVVIKQCFFVLLQNMIIWMKIVILCYKDSSGIFTGNCLWFQTFVTSFYFNTFHVISI